MDVWIQIMLIALGMSVFAQLLRRILKMDSKHIKPMQNRLRELSRELDTSRASTMGNMQVGKPTRSYDEINKEIMALMKKMAKEQLIPTCLQCGIFLGIFGIISAFYGSYTTNVISFPFLFFGSGWYGAYFLFSLIFGFGFMGIQALIKKLTHQDQKVMPEIPGMPTSGNISWKDRLEAAKKETQGENKPENPPSH